jgi:hypothetical protein
LQDAGVDAARDLEEVVMFGDCVARCFIDHNTDHGRTMARVRIGSGLGPMRTRRADRKTDRVAAVIDPDDQLCWV